MWQLAPLPKATSVPSVCPAAPQHPHAAPCSPGPSLFSLCCIASVLAAKVLHGVEVTVGHEQEEGGRWPYAGTAEAIKALGAKHCVKEVTISFLPAVVTGPPSGPGGLRCWGRLGARASQA